ncbi:MAG: extracellular solute-binding protein [Clostridiales bacterium]|nr:extracellular solute-binding protein [Clostridiales bacterium]
MIKRIFSLICALILSLSSFSFVACDNNLNETDGTVLRVCNCEDYIDTDLLDEFEEETGITVEYSTYGTNENLYNELVINPNSYDLVVPSEYMIEKLAEEGRIQKFDFSKLEDYTNNLSPYIKGRLDNLQFTVKDGKYEGEEVSLSEFMVGYMWGTMGWVYNTDYVTEQEVSSWDGVFYNPDLAKKITIKDAVRDSYIVGLAMVYQNELKQATTNEEITEILNNVNQDAIDRVGEKLNSLKPMLYGFEVDSGKNDIVLGNIYAYVAWSGDACYAIDVAAREVEDDDGSLIDEEDAKSLSYSIPDEGSNIWFDGFVMPSGSTNYDAVYKFLEFISRPENVYRNMNYTGYTGMVANGEFELEVEDEEGNVSVETTDIFNSIVIDWFDESEDLEDGEGVEVNLSYFFAGNPEGDYIVKVSEESYGRLIAQYPTFDIVQKCAIMNNFSSDTLMQINDMWEGVKGETFPDWLIILIVALVIALAVVILLSRNAKNIKTFKIPERKLTSMEKKGYKIIKVEEVE